MPSFKQTKALPYSAEFLHDMIMDIEKYPEFLPWCSQAKITKIISNNSLEAILLINFKNLFEKYTSLVNHGKNDEGYFIDVNAIQGPFKKLTNQWRLKNIENHCQIEFFVEFEFNSFLLEKMIGAIFEKAAVRMMDAFEVRAEFLKKLG